MTREQLIDRAVRRAFLNVPPWDAPKVHMWVKQHWQFFAHGQGYRAHLANATNSSAGSFFVWNLKDMK